VWNLERPVLLGVAGDSAAGKTTMSRGIADALGPDRVTVICSDDYHRYGRVRRAELGITPLDPKCNYLDILAQHLRLLREGQPILKPVYDHSIGELTEPEYVEPREFVIIEGLHGLANRHLREVFDARVFLNPPLPLRTRWKIKRDVSKRGYTEAEVIAALHKRESDSKTFIAPQREHADIVIVFSEPADPRPDDRQLDVQMVLRPTLAHPNLEVLTYADGPIRQSLGRDEGRPVDLLEIDGHIGPESAEAAEEEIYRHFSLGASDLPTQLGKVDAGLSHPLAIAQLIVVGHVLTARRPVAA
jgi:phosphoribulokinase